MRYQLSSRLRGLLLTLATLGLLAQVACVSPFILPEDAPPSVKYYAALQDYNTVKLIAVRYVQTPSTPLSEGVKVLEIVEEADARIKSVGLAITAQGGNLNDTYTVAASALRMAADELRRIAVKAEE